MLSYVFLKTLLMLPFFSTAYGAKPATKHLPYLSFAPLDKREKG